MSSVSSVNMESYTGPPYLSRIPTSINSILQDITSNVHTPQSGKLKLDMEEHSTDAQSKCGFLYHFHCYPFTFCESHSFINHVKIIIDSIWRCIAGVEVNV